MPVQRTLFGKLITIRLPPRRFQIAFCFILFLIVTLLVFEGPDPVQDRIADVKEQVGEVLEGIPAALHNPFRHVHRPPQQANSASGDSSWFEHLEWRNPFSASVTYDERSVLPPLRVRPPIYTYYETANARDKDARHEEENILFAWRRAWWAAGFRPLVLGKGEAMNSPLYGQLKLLKGMELDPGFEYELRRWLAWSTMGTGILANWLMFPMGSPTDVLLSFLRKGDDPDVKAIKSFGEGLVYGEKSKIKALLENVFKHNQTNTTLAGIKKVTEVPGAEYLKMDQFHSSIALYDLRTIEEEYPHIARTLNATEGQAIGLNMLAKLINSHLHLTWQTLFAQGIAVLKPLSHMTILTNPAMDIAVRLAECPESPLPRSCPPKQQCTPCTASLPIRTIPSLRNESGIYVIGSVPHPYTAAVLHSWRKDINLAFIRRNLTRDVWIQAVTDELLPQGYGSSRRLVPFKDAIASEEGETHSLWLTAEGTTHRDINWKFGFALPESKSSLSGVRPATGVTPSSSSSGIADDTLPPATPESNSTATTPVNAPAESDIRPDAIGPHPSGGSDGAAQEWELLDLARRTLKRGTRQAVMLRRAAEAWSQADAEAWRFAKAFAARRRKERKAWEGEERAFAGAVERKWWW